MKIKNLLPSVLLLILFSCEKTESDIVKEEFEKYVYENFDDPRDLKEIVSIEITDTITKEDIYELLYSFNELDSSTFALDSVVTHYYTEGITQQIKNNYSAMSNLPYYQILKATELYCKVGISLRSKISFDETSYKKSVHEIDSIAKSLADFEYIQYNIKTRIENESEKTVLKNYHALVKQNRIDIYDKEPAIMDYSPEIKELFELNNKRVDSLEIYRTSIIKMAEDINNFKEYMEECGIFFL